MTAIPDDADRLLMLVDLLTDIDLEGILAEVSHTDALGPILDPTAYRDMLQNGDHLHALEAVALAAIPLRDVFKARVGPLIPADTEENR